MSSWKTAYFCVNCDKEISHHSVMYNHGRCPLCDFKHPTACTIVETYTKPKIWVKHKSTWWNPRTWNRGHWEYGNKDERC